MLRCQAQLELTLMMCLGDRSTFTLTGTLSGRHDGSSPLFLEDLLSSRGVCVFARAQALSPPNLFTSTSIKFLDFDMTESLCSIMDLECKTQTMIDKKKYLKI